MYATFRPRDVRGDLIGSGLVPVLVLGDGEGCTPLEYCGIGKYCWTGQGFSGDFAVRVGMDGEWVSEPVELFQVGGDNSVPLDNGMECSPFLAGAEEGEEPDTATEDTTGENEGPDAADGESSEEDASGDDSSTGTEGDSGVSGRGRMIRRILPTEGTDSEDGGHLRSGGRRGISRYARAGYPQMDSDSRKPVLKGTSLAKEPGDAGTLVETRPSLET